MTFPGTCYRLYRNDHSGLQPCARTLDSVIVYQRIFVKFATYTVTGQLPDNRISGSLDFFLNQVTDGAQPHSLTYCIDGRIKCRPDRSDKLLIFFTYRADGERESRIATKTILSHTAVNRHDVTVFQRLGSRDAVDCDVIY